MRGQGRCLALRAKDGVGAVGAELAARGCRPQPLRGRLRHAVRSGGLIARREGLRESDSRVPKSDSRRIRRFKFLSNEIRVSFFDLASLLDGPTNVVCVPIEPLRGRCSPFEPSASWPGTKRLIRGGPRACRAADLAWQICLGVHRRLPMPGATAGRLRGTPDRHQHLPASRLWGRGGRRFLTRRSALRGNIPGLPGWYDPA